MFIVGFADDLTLVATTKIIEELYAKIDQALRTIGTWIIESRGLALVSERKCNVTPINIDGCKILGVTFDKNLCFKQYPENTSGKAIRMVTAI